MGYNGLAAATQDSGLESWGWIEREACAVCSANLLSYGLRGVVVMHFRFGPNAKEIIPVSETRQYRRSIEC